MWICIRELHLKKICNEQMIMTKNPEVLGQALIPDCYRSGVNIGYRAVNVTPCLPDTSHVSSQKRSHWPQCLGPAKCMCIAFCKQLMAASAKPCHACEALDGCVCQARPGTLPGMLEMCCCEGRWSCCQIKCCCRVLQSYDPSPSRCRASFLCHLLVRPWTLPSEQPGSEQGPKC